MLEAYEFTNAIEETSEPMSGRETMDWQALGRPTEHSYSLADSAFLPNEENSEETRELDHIICQFLKEQKVPGATLAVAKNGQIVYQQGYGVAGAGRRMRSATKLRVASISKPVTAIAVLRLCEERRLSLNDKVFGVKGILKKLNKWRDKRVSKITVRHLLQHSSGWDRDVAGDAIFWKVAPPSDFATTSPQYNSHLLQYVLRRKLQFTPGTKHAYSNLGYLALGEVIEAVTGQTYEDYIKGLLSEIGISGMFVGREGRADWQSDEGEYFNIKEPATAVCVLPGYEDSQVLPQYGSFLMSNTGAYGGWVATAADIVKIFCSLEYQLPQNTETQSLLQPCSIKTMLERPSYEQASSRDWYGLGLDVQDCGTTWGHTGAMEGTCGTTQRHVSGLAWAFLLNAWTADMDLDGVVKCALSTCEKLSPFPQSVVTFHGTVREREDPDQTNLDSLCHSIEHRDTKPHFPSSSMSSTKLQHFKVTCTDKQFSRITAREYQHSRTDHIEKQPHFISRMTCITTKGKTQLILLHVPLDELDWQVEANQSNGFALEWVGVNIASAKRGENVTFTAIFKKAAPNTETQNLNCDEQPMFEGCAHPGLIHEETALRNKCRTICEEDTIDCNSCKKGLTKEQLFQKGEDSPYYTQEKKLLICDHNDLESVLKMNSMGGYTPEIVTVFRSNGALQALVILSQSRSRYPVLDFYVPAEKYVQWLTKRKKSGYRVVSQCPFEKESQLYVTALMVKYVEKEEQSSPAKEGILKDEDYSFRIPQRAVVESVHSSNEMISEQSVQGKAVSAQQSDQIGAYKHVCEEFEPQSPSRSEEESAVSCLVTTNESRTISCTEQSIKSNSFTESEVITTSAPVECTQTTKEMCLQTYTSCRTRTKHNVEDDVNCISDSHASKSVEKHACVSTESTQHSVCNNQSSKEEAVLTSSGLLPCKRIRLQNCCGCCKPSYPVKFSPLYGIMDSDKNVSLKVAEMEKLLLKEETFTSSSFASACEDNLVSEDCKPSKRVKRNYKPISTKKKTLSTGKNLSWVQMTVDSFITELGRQARHRCRLANIHFYPVGENGEWYVSGVWLPVCDAHLQAQAKDAKSEFHDCYHRMSVSSFGLLPAIAEAAARNVLLRFVCQYEEDGALYHALFWDAVC